MLGGGGGSADGGRSARESRGGDGDRWEGAPERVIESRARSLLYRPPYTAPSRARRPPPHPETYPANPLATDAEAEAGVTPEFRRVFAHSASFSPPCCLFPRLSPPVILARSLSRVFKGVQRRSVYVS